jgi:glycosyltransferase involved in cell wall biosynthesis
MSSWKCEATLVHGQNVIKEKPRVVIAGKKPPPIGGQNLLIAELLEDLQRDGRGEISHLDLAFTKDWKKARRFTPQKLVELWNVRRSMRELAGGQPVDLLLYPVGGPQTVPLFRDALLLPLLRPYCRCLVMHFHAAGYAKVAAELRFPLSWAVRRAYARVDEAIVMTEFGREDPVVAGIPRIHVCPNLLSDVFTSGKILGRGHGDRARLLYLGHVYDEKGVPELLAALRGVAPAFELRIVGDCLAPWSPDKLRARIREFGLNSKVTYIDGVDAKGRDEELARADFLIFPSRAHESFGLVLAEAMMWKLPIITFDWRGNAEVVGKDPGGLLLPNNDRVAELRDGINKMLESRDHWEEWGEKNRQRFLAQFRKPEGSSPMVELLLQLASN